MNESFEEQLAKEISEMSDEQMKENVDKTFTTGRIGRQNFNGVLITAKSLQSQKKIKSKRSSFSNKKENVLSRNLKRLIASLVMLGNK